MITRKVAAFLAGCWMFAAAPALAVTVFGVPSVNAVVTTPVNLTTNATGYTLEFQILSAAIFAVNGHEGPLGDDIQNITVSIVGETATSSGQAFIPGSKNQDFVSAQWSLAPGTYKLQFGWTVALSITGDIDTNFETTIQLANCRDNCANTRDVPLPAALLLFGGGLTSLGGVSFLRRRRNRKLA